VSIADYVREQAKKTTEGLSQFFRSDIKQLWPRLRGEEILKRAEALRGELEERLEGSYGQLLKTLGLAAHEEIEALKGKVDALEKELAALKGQPKPEA
jgi:polyhydroxyalkanoate synthesis regulator phasin